LLYLQENSQLLASELRVVEIKLSFLRGFPSHCRCGTYSGNSNNSGIGATVPKIDGVALFDVIPMLPHQPRQIGQRLKCALQIEEGWIGLKHPSASSITAGVRAGRGP